MINTARTLKTFFGSFGIPAYTLQSVPEEVQLPFLTYPLMEPEWDQESTMYCQVWYPKNHLADLLEKADAIAKAVGTMKEFPQEGGYVVLYPSTPFIQILTDDKTQSAYINLILRTYHMPGD